MTHMIKFTLTAVPYLAMYAHGSYLDMMVMQVVSPYRAVINIILACNYLDTLTR